MKKKQNLEASGENRRRGTMGNLFCFVFFFFSQALTRFVTTTATTRLANTNAPIAMKTRRKSPPPT